MKYIKSFNEELTFDLPQVEFTKKVDGNEVKYSFNCEDYDWYVLFTWSENGQKWTRDYDVEKKHYVVANIDSQMNFMQVAKNPLKIVSAVTYITQKFIEEYSPECITILHINMKSEKCTITQMNKRSRLNFTFLAKYIKGYTFHYYAFAFSDSKDVVSNRSSGTLAVICRQGNEAKYLEFFDKSNNHVRIK